MATEHTQVIIVGGGLSGLYAAYMLQQQGIDYRVLEARERLGGRILGVQGPQGEAIDLGPAWFWPAMQPELDKLISELKLARFAQYDSGDMLVERSLSEAPARHLGYANSPPSMRLRDGMQGLINALAAAVNPAHVHVNTHVSNAVHSDTGVQVSTENGRTWSARHVLIAVPPRVALDQITFQPALPNNLVSSWQATETWMAPHAKYVACYSQAFWRAHGLSGAAHSMRGPLVEIHDASQLDQGYALFGFLGVPAHLRKRIPTAELKAHCRAQLVRLFGDEAANPNAEYVCDWAAQPLTAATTDASHSGQHPRPALRGVDQGAWSQVMTGIASEFSPQFTGYLAGAVHAAALAVDAIIQAQEKANVAHR